MGKLTDRLLIGVTSNYLRLVHMTSKIVFTGYTDARDAGEKYLFGFWHGDSYSFFPLLDGRGDVIITTVNRRGDYIDGLGKAFGLVSARLPDDPDSAGAFSGIRFLLNAAKDQHIATSMDGPLGPYHIPKRFVLTIAYLAKKRIVPISLTVKRKIVLTRRWDNYVIPLPFSHITFDFHEPVTVHKDKLEEASDRIIEEMNEAYNAKTRV